MRLLAPTTSRIYNMESGKIIIKVRDKEYILNNNSNKYERALRAAGEGASEEQVLAYYDKLAGLIRDFVSGQKIENGQFWKTEKNKILSKTKKEDKKIGKRIWGIIGGIAIIFGLIWTVIQLYDRFAPQPDPNNLSLVEYIFGNQYYYVQAITNSNNRVIAYSITTLDKDFNPSFEVLKDAFQADTKDTSNLEKAKSLAFNIILGKSKFSEIPERPENIIGYLGARRILYKEEYYFGNPGKYQSYFMGVNDSGYLDFDNSDLSFFNEDRILFDDEGVRYFRENSVINTFSLTAPFEGINNKELREYSTDLHKLI